MAEDEDEDEDGDEAVDGAGGRLLCAVETRIPVRLEGTFAVWPGGRHAWQG